jgi:F-type H+-transporting ATPase subunit a
MSLFALDFPPLGHLVDFKDFAFKNTLFGINKVVLVYFFAIILTFALFILGNKKQMVPSGMQIVAESTINLVEDNILMQTMGHDGLGWAPFMTTVFLFVFFTNIFEIIPVIQMPANAKFAMPLVLAMLVWVLYNAFGIKSQGFFHYMKSSLFPPGVPKALYLLVVPIEFVSNFLVRPFSLMVRLFANLLAGHILLVTFTILSASLWTAKWYAVFLPLPVIMVIFFTVFEILVAFLQAYVFTLLASVYIGSSIHPDH